jgi:hypothetical protein
MYNSFDLLCLKSLRNDLHLLQYLPLEEVMVPTPLFKEKVNFISVGDATILVAYLLNFAVKNCLIFFWLASYFKSGGYLLWIFLLTEFLIERDLYFYLISPLPCL